MKTTLFSRLTLLFTIVVFYPTAWQNSLAENTAPERTVRLIYFLPSDATPQRDIHTELDVLIKNVQQLYANEMQRHAHGRKTFTIETDNNNKAVVHRVNGQFPSAHYRQKTLDKVTTELTNPFDASKNIYLIVIELASESFDDGNSCGTATNVHGETAGGYALIPASGHCVAGNSDIALAAHELGHNFGLIHDFSADEYIMSYGHHRRIFSACAAEWLSVHRYFNAGGKHVDRPTVIEMLKAEAEPPDAIRFRFKVSDPNGLHQAQLETNTTAVPGAVGQAEMLVCRSLKGTQTRTFDLVTTELTVRGTSAVGLRVMDAFGNSMGESFPIQDFSIAGPKIEGPWLWMIVPTRWRGGAAAAASGIDYLSEVTHAAVTEREIATHGATAGDPVGNNVWTPVKIAPIGKDNLTEVARTIGYGIGTIDRAVIYGSLKLESPKKQKTLMFAGSDDAVKVWLNGELVHNNPIDRAGEDYQDHFPVTLQSGENVLLVAVYENWGEWSGFFGFQKDAVYTVMEIEGGPVARSKRPGPKIEGPWLWMIAPTGRMGGAQAAASGIDWLSFASGGGVTEKQVATNGTTVGDEVGNRVWTVGKLSAIGGNNINEMVNAIGLGSGDIENHVAYGYMALDSPRPQKTTMYVGSDDAVQVWLNGTLVHNNPIDRGANDYQDAFPVTLKQGRNILFVAVYEFWGGWSGFFGFESNAVYTTSMTVAAKSVVPTWDVNADRQTNILDLVLVAQHLGGTASANSRVDVNNDGIINILDLVLVAQHLGESTANAAPSSFVKNSRLDPERIQRWIALANAQNDGSMRFQNGIANLQRLLTSLLPKETVLLANYPNPFNPETWIPYKLAKPADVAVSIYSVNGTLVRTLSFGHQPAGVYHSKSRAAYWDGRNAVGESVASGLYFYTLTAGEFTATRKLLIRK